MNDIHLDDINQLRNPIGYTCLIPDESSAYVALVYSMKMWRTYIESRVAPTSLYKTEYFLKESASIKLLFQVSYVWM